MIEWVNDRLVRWGEWTAGARVRGGGGSTYPAYQMVHIRGTAATESLVDFDVLQLDKVMAHVKVWRPELYDTAHGRYVRGLSNALIAGQMRCHRDTVHSRLDFLHKFVEKRLTDCVTK